MGFHVRIRGRRPGVRPSLLHDEREPLSQSVTRRGLRAAVAAVATGSLLTAGLVTSAGTALAAPPAKPKAEKDLSKSHDLRGPQQVKQDGLRQRALDEVLAGKAKPVGKDKVVKVAPGQYVQLARESTDKIFVVLAEFGDARHPSYPDLVPDTRATPAQTFSGPMHNQIPAPDRAVDNSTLWKSDYSQAHYEDMYFNRMARYYEAQSSGRYSVEGDTTAWVKVPFNQARYGRNYCGDIVCGTTRLLIRDALAFWVDGQLKSGRTMDQIKAYLADFDVQDRYDLDGDGDFTEPDGFIDHFQIVHAGGDEASADPVYGEDAIWSHRSYAAVQAGGPFGETGVNIGSGLVDAGQSIPNNPTGLWVGDYTIQPENGGLGVFAHEFGHDLGLPDLYDTSGNTGGAENSTAFWSLMSSGANIGDGSPDGIGDAPVDMGTWEKLQLGWLDYETARAGQRSNHRLAPAISASKQAQALITVLPEKVVPLELGAPCATCGSRYFFSGADDDLNTTMTRSVSGGGPLTAQVRYDIEEDWDYAFLEASANGTTWTPVLTNLSDGADDASGFNASQTGLTGVQAAWTTLTATLPAGTTSIRFRYQTDGAVVRPGFQVDEITVGGTKVGTAEQGEQGWTLQGFRTTTGSEQLRYPNYYIAENRQYIGYDRSLRTAYNFGFTNTRPDLVETHPYENGLLINYWDTSQSDNNVGEHPGKGLLLPVDAHPSFDHSYDGHLLRPRILSYDSTFGLEPTTSITVHKDGRPTTIPSRPAVPVFDDARSWWSNADQHAATGAHVGRYEPGWYGVDVPKTGTEITVKSVAGTGFMQVQVS